MELKEIIPLGYKNRISYKNIHDNCGITLRRLQKEIEDSEDFIIHLDGGFFYPTKEDTAWVNIWKAREISRATATFRHISKAKKWTHEIADDELNGNIYRSARLLKGYTTAEACILLEIDGWLLDFIESGKIVPGEAITAKMSEIYEVEV